MKNYRYPLLLNLFLILSFGLQSSPGDTTWVTVYNLRKLDHYGHFDTVAVFPAKKQYRKIRMHYILGRYACPPNTQYCGSWDYTTKVYLLPPSNDSVEIARVITPYATDWLQQGRKHDYIVEVTDYSSLLHDTTGFRFVYEGYSWGFTITLKIEFIEGTPPREALAVENIYDGYFPYGNASNSIENYLVPDTLNYTTAQAVIKNSISGHGADATGCSEFCNKYYALKINNSQAAQKQIWRSDCGLNQVYPQTGTWVFDRSNWCPGAVVWPIYHSLDGITSPSLSFIADIDMQPYTISNPSGGYNFVSQLISYTDFNHLVDASIEDIISPSLDANWFRDNPSCNQPMVKIRNTGRTPVQQVVLEYGLSGRTMSTYTYNSTLDVLEEELVVLPPSPAVMAHSVSARFEARIRSVDGQPGDDNAENNYHYSMTKTVTIIPKDFIVRMTTNGSSAGGLSETSWRLLDAGGQIVASRTNGTANKVYTDSIKNLPDGCYKLEVTDAGCDGFSWWYYQYYTPNPGNGSMRIDNIGGSPMYLIPGDIGCGYSRYFHVGAYPAPPPLPDPVGLQAPPQVQLLELYPNPASDEVTLRIGLYHSAHVSYIVRDIRGRALLREELGRTEITFAQIPCTALPPGVYFVEVFADGRVIGTRKLALMRD